MQITFHPGPHSDGGPGMAGHVEAAIHAAMDRFGERVTRTEAHLAVADGSQGVTCTLQAHVVGREPVVARDTAGSAHQAVDGALRKLKRAVGAQLAQHDPRRQRAPALPLMEDDPAA